MKIPPFFSDVSLTLARRFEPLALQRRISFTVDAPAPLSIQAVRPPRARG